MRNEAIFWLSEKENKNRKRSHFLHPCHCEEFRRFSDRTTRQSHHTESRKRMKKMKITNEAIFCIK